MSQHNGNGNKVWTLDKRRSQIDRLDAEIVRLLNRRAKIACELGVIKVASGLPAYDARREQQVLARIRKHNRGPLDAESITRIFRRVILETRRIGKWSMQQERTRYRQKSAKGYSNGN